MIKLEQVVKYYNKNKVNQFTVCNDINLVFENTGLVVILGASGSGKTTLLNVLSGMDSFDSGTLTFDDVVFNKYNQNKWDLIRKEKIGYIYQNYHLLKGLSVYQNIEPVFKMQGITDEILIREKVIQLLDTVGMANFIDRLVKQLSGGQQQRIAFARALANNPKVILADEPTGNLDGKTTIEVMNVIKQISKTRLIIMVTHERQLCQYYADRIIEIEDGKIVEDKINENQQHLDIIQEHIITLSDFNKSISETNGMNVSRYSNKLEPEELDIKLIERNQTLYVKINSDAIKRTKYIDDDSEIIIQETREYDETIKNPFALDDVYPNKKKDVKDLHFSFEDSFKYALRKLNIFQKGSKMLFIAMFLLGIIISISVGLIGEIFDVHEPFSTLDSNYITVNMSRTQYDDYALLEDVEGVDQLMLVNEPYLFKVSSATYYEVNDSMDVSAQPIDIKFFDESTIIYGEMASGYEIIIDKSVADKMIVDYSNRGVQTYEDILNCSFKIQGHGMDYDLAVDSALNFKISGIANTNALSVWMKEDLLYSLVTPSLIDYHVLGDNFEIIDGDIPTSTTYLMINENYPSLRFNNSMPYNIGISTGTYYLSGTYAYVVDGVSYDLQKLFVTELDYMKTKFFTNAFFRHSDFTLLVYASDVDKAVANLEAAGYDVDANSFEPSFAQQMKFEENIILYWMGLGGIVMSAFIIFLIMRSSLISRMYEVSVYRSIGISRKEIKKIFFIELILTTTLSSVLGFLLMVILLNQAQASIDTINITHFTFLSIVLVIIGMYAVNIVFGLMPINNLLRKTPSTIMKQNDL